MKMREDWIPNSSEELAKEKLRGQVFILHSPIKSIKNEDLTLCPLLTNSIRGAAVAASQ
jgi:hypothetical protein